MMAVPASDGGFGATFWSQVFMPHFGQDSRWMWHFNDSQYAS